MGKEVIIKKVPTPILVFYIGSIFLVGYGIERLLNYKYLGGIILVIFGIIFFYLRKLEPKKSKELIKITDEKLWVRNIGNMPWDKILYIKFRHVTQTVYMDIYRSNEIIADHEVDLRSINMAIWRLKWILKKHVNIGKSRKQ